VRYCTVNFAEICCKILENFGVLFISFIFMLFVSSIIKFIIEKSENSSIFLLFSCHFSTFLKLLILHRCTPLNEIFPINLFPSKKHCFSRELTSKMTPPRYAWYVQRSSPYFSWASHMRLTVCVPEDVTLKHEYLKLRVLFAD
jgi:apolipoprotein N-acyltransferase